MQYDPLRCRSCAAILNPYCRVDFVGKLWICPFCYARNPFPAHYSSISEQCQPAELFPPYTTIEYAPPSAPRGPPPTFVFLVDTCVIEEELAAMKAVRKIGITAQHSSWSLCYESCVYISKFEIGCAKLSVGCHCIFHLIYRRYSKHYHCFQTPPKSVSSLTVHTFKFTKSAFRSAQGQY